MRICTSRGILQPRRLGQVPRLSSGPDLLQILLGSEGQMGVISEATIKIFPIPEQRCFGAIIFPGKLILQTKIIKKKNFF